MIVTEQKTEHEIKPEPDLEKLIRRKCGTDGCTNYQNPNYYHDMDKIKDHTHGGLWSILVYCKYMTPIRFSREELEEKGVI